MNTNEQAAKATGKGGVGGGGEEAAPVGAVFKAFARALLPAWSTTTSSTTRRSYADELLEALEDPNSVARAIFDLGRRWESRNTAARLIAARRATGA